MLPLIHAMFAATALDHRFLAGETSVLSVSLAELAAYGSGFILVLWLLRNSQGRRKAFHAALAWPNGAYFAWIAVASVTALVFTGRNDGLHELKDCAPGVIMFLAFAAWVETPEQLERVVTGIVASLCALGLLGISQLAFGGPYFNPVQDIAFDKTTVTGLGRVVNPSVGTFGTQNTYAVFLGPLFVFSVISTIERARRIGRRPSAPRMLQLGVVFTALLATQAKLALAITCLGIGTFLVMVPLRIRPTKGAVLAILGIVVLSIVGMITMLAMFEQDVPLGLQLGTMRGRLGLAAEATQFIAATPGVALVGGGAAAFQEVRGLNFNVHNELLLQSLKWGVIGAALFTLVLTSTLLGTGASSWAGPIGVMVALLIYMFETASGNQQQTALFLLLALAQAQSRFALRPTREAGVSGQALQ